MATSTSKSPIAGYNIYLNEHNQKILLDPITKTGYLVKESDYKQFNLYHNRWPLAIAIAALVYSFTQQVTLAIAIGIGFGLVMEYRYRSVWLASLPQYPNFKPIHKVTFIQGLLQQKQAWNCFVLAIAYAAFGILLLIYGIQKQDGPVLLAFEGIIMLAAVFRAGQYLIAFYKLLSQKKN